MSFNAQFSITPSANASTFRLTDTSTGSDADLTGRKVSLYLSDGSLLVPVIPWDIADDFIDLDVLPADMALNVSVLWESSNPDPDPSTYIYSEIYAFVKYAQQFLYALSQEQQARPWITQDRNYYENKLTIFCEVLSAQNCIDTGNDLAGAQSAILRYQQYINNAQYYF